MVITNLQLYFKFVIHGIADSSHGQVCKGFSPLSECALAGRTIRKPFSMFAKGPSILYGVPDRTRFDTLDLDWEVEFALIRQLFEETNLVIIS